MKTVENVEATALPIAQRFDKSAKVTLWEKHGHQRLYIKYPEMVEYYQDGGWIDLKTGFKRYPFKKVAKVEKTESFIGTMKTTTLVYKNHFEARACDVLDEIAKQIFIEP